MRPSPHDIALAHVLVKTERAKKHLLDLEALSRNSIKGIAFSRDSKGQLRYPPEPSLTVSVHVIGAAGDVIHNLRSALDHLAWELAKWSTGAPKKPRKCCFPIGWSLDNYKEIKKSGAVAGMSPEAKKLIDGLNPYKGGNPALWRIHYLDIVDKHHHLLFAGYRIQFSDTGLPGNVGIVNDEPTYFVGLFDDDFQGENQSPFQPAPPEFEASDVKPLIPALHELLVFTEDLIKNFRPLLTLRKS